MCGDQLSYYQLSHTRSRRTSKAGLAEQYYQTGSSGCGLVPWPLPYLALCVHPVADTKPSWRHSTLAFDIVKSSSQMVPHSPLWNSSIRPSLCLRGYPDSLTFRPPVWDWGDGDRDGDGVGVGVGVGVGFTVVALDGVVWVKQQGNHNPNRRLNANCSHRLDLSMTSAARGEETKTASGLRLQKHAHLIIYIFKKTSEKSVLRVGDVTARVTPMFSRKSCSWDKEGLHT